MLAEARAAARGRRESRDVKSPLGALTVRLLGILGLILVAGTSVVDISEGRWWLAIVRIGVIGALAYVLYRSSRRRGNE